MFEKYTDKAKRVIYFARYEAGQAGSPHITPEHILIGLLRVGDKFLTKLSRSHDLRIEEIREHIISSANYVHIESSDIPFSEVAKIVLNIASEESDKLGHAYIGNEHILLALLQERSSFANQYLDEKGIKISEIKEEAAFKHRSREKEAKKKETPFLEEFSRDLTRLAEEEKLDPLIGRSSEIKRLHQILCRRTKNNPVLIGEPGVGKTAIVEGLAQNIVDGNAPAFLYGKRILALDLSSVVAGTKYRGQFEERMKSIMKELVENDEIIIFIDELHTIVGAGSAEGSLDAAGILKPALSRGELKCIGATTPKEYRNHIEKDRALERRFQGVKVAAPSQEESIKILDGIKGRYEEFHNVKYTRTALEAAVSLSMRYISDRNLPDKAVDVMDEAGARVKLENVIMPKEVQSTERSLRSLSLKMEHAIAEREFEKAARLRDEEMKLRMELEELKDRLSRGAASRTIRVNRAIVEKIISDWTSIPMVTLKESEMQRLLHIEEELRKRVVGQDSSIEVLARSIRRSRMGIKNPSRPAGSFLFLGATGVGKTEVARTLSRYLFGNEKHLVRFDMSEYMERHSVSKLIGSPPGYVGYDEGGQLTDVIKRNPYSIILLDEIEKAHPDIFNVLLQVFDEGQLTDAHGNTVDFKNTMIIMTSNIGARYIQKGGRVGFRKEEETEEFKRIEELVMGEVRKTFTPEFINRLDETIVFNMLNDDDLINITHMLLIELNDVIKDRGISVRMTDDAAKWLVNKACRNRTYGARPLRRAIQSHIEDLLAEKVIKGEVKKGGVVVHLKDDELVLKPEKQKKKKRSRQVAKTK